MFDLGRTIVASAARTPDIIALSDGASCWTYAEWLDLICTVVSGLDVVGIARGEHLVSVLQNRAEAATLHWACQLAGIIITPVNWRCTAEELDFIIRDAEASAVVYEEITAELVQHCRLAAKIQRIDVDAGRAATCSWQALCAATPVAPESRSTPDDTSVMLYTSGTTGQGKGVPRQHAVERAASVAHVAQNQYGPHEVSLGVMPLYHTMGVRTLLASALVSGHFVCQRRFLPDESLELIQLHRVSNLFLVPTLYHDLLESAAFEQADVTSVAKLGFAGQSMTAGLIARLDKAFCPQQFVNHYGSSEIYTFTVEPDVRRKPGSAGKAGLNQEIRIVDIDATDASKPLLAGTEGQIIAALDGDESFSGYWKRAEADSRALHAGWYFTGDIGYFDGDGDLHVTGRIDDMMISGGENILPAEIESVLSLHPAVKEVAVAGLMDERLGQAVTAFVVTSTNKEISAEMLDRWCLDSDLADFKRPRRYIFIREIPKSPVGKILRRQLVEGDYNRAAS